MTAGNSRQNRSVDNAQSDSVLDAEVWIDYAVGGVGRAHGGRSARVPDAIMTDVRMYILVSPTRCTYVVEWFRMYSSIAIGVVAFAKAP
jgi:hypothetical protein